MGLISKYNMQYRRAWPKHEMLPTVERWYTMRLSDLPHGALEVLHGQNFSVAWQELRELLVGREELREPPVSDERLRRLPEKGNRRESVRDGAR